MDFVCIVLMICFEITYFSPLPQRHFKEISVAYLLAIIVCIHHSETSLFTYESISKFFLPDIPMDELLKALNGLVLKGILVYDADAEYYTFNILHPWYSHFLKKASAIEINMKKFIKPASTSLTKA